ncbi:MAG: ferritin-like protein [Calothrix sp. MO_192.B10]|nr:ferritin-like protein [Calothrix sp. MO_192.B10]
MPELTAAVLEAATKTLQTEGYVSLEVKDDLDGELKDVRTHLQNALKIEHTTIPIYLNMLYTLKPGASWRVLECIRSVVIEEMLHFVLAGNVLNAIGGEPHIYYPQFMPDFPTWLPYKVDGAKVSLLHFSPEAVDQGLLIERAAYIRAEKVLQGVDEGMTIGEFYTYIESKIRALVQKFGEKSVFCGDRNKQVTPHLYYYDGGGAIVEVYNLETAIEAMQIIKDQGEGAHHGIWTGESQVLAGYPEVAHYFRFNELKQGRLYQHGDTIKTGPTGEAIQVPWENVYPTFPNAKLRDYPEGSEVRLYIEAFNRKYSELLCLLEYALNGKPDRLLESVVRMCALRSDYEPIVRNPFPGKPGYFAVPTFEFVGGLTCPPSSQDTTSFKTLSQLSAQRKQHEPQH